MIVARNWREIRAEAIAQGRLDPARADAARKEMHDAVQAQRLADIRKAHGHARQADVAALMGVSQARVSKLESGDLSHTEVGTYSPTWPRSAGICVSSPSLTRALWNWVPRYTVPRTLGLRRGSKQFLGWAPFLAHPHTEGANLVGALVFGARRRRVRHLNGVHRVIAGSGATAQRPVKAAATSAPQDAQALW